MSKWLPTLTKVVVVLVAALLFNWLIRWNFFLGGLLGFAFLSALMFFKAHLVRSGRARVALLGAEAPWIDRLGLIAFSLAGAMFALVAIVALMRLL